MEINRFEDVLGVVAQSDMVEGRFVCLTSNAFAGLYMNTYEDVPGAKLPQTAEEAKRAKYCVTFAVDNRTPPIIEVPNTSFDFRGGWVRSQSDPLNTRVWLTPPGLQEGQTIPSGSMALAYTEGTFTLPSGSYIYNAGLTTPGAAVMVADAATDGAANAGKLKYTATMAVGVIGVVEKYDASTGALTVRVE
jgi:hypothetical protein